MGVRVRQKLQKQMSVSHPVAFSLIWEKVDHFLCEQPLGEETENSKLVENRQDGKG